MELPALKTRLDGFVREILGPNCQLSYLEKSDGHAGLTYLFGVKDGQNQLSEFVLKIPPAGVRLKGNTDVLRQAPLLNALNDAGLPVPKVPYAYDENAWFDRPFIVMEKLPGRVFFVWEPHQSFAHEGEQALSIWRQCVEQLSALHRIDWQSVLPDWEAPEELGDNLARWQAIYRHALEPNWIQLAEETERRLIDHLPDDYQLGLFHGDFQPGNLLYEDYQFVAVIDWELSGISAQALDLGWLLMVVDEKNWISNYRPVSPISEQEVLSIYQSGMGYLPDDHIWFQAFAGYRLASIACLNHKLHVTGKRIEPAWESLGQCVVPMFERAQALLANYK
ncbi:MAG: phosphotransferase family protein [Pseudomonadota bacterium]